jgi:NAD(P)-dependent dehydrogenase (short-subunit alcohol dehydrogenase family)
MGWLDDQVALVTGGGSGIGRAIVSRFIDEGARVGVLERVADRVEQLRADFGHALCAVQGDVTQLADNTRAVEETVKAGTQGSLTASSPWPSFRRQRSATPLTSSLG